MSKTPFAAFLPIAGTAAVTLGLTGCTSIRVHLGARVHLDKIPVNAMVVSMPQKPNHDPGIAPGGKSRLVATFTDTNGKTWVTEGKGKGKILWSDIAVTPTLVTYKKGTLSLPSDPRLSEQKTGHIDISVPSHPSLHDALDVPVRYDYAFKADFSGSSGINGTNGSDGSDGTTGFTGSTDPDNPSAGGDGGNGSDGSNGSDGGDGSNGLDVTVQVTLRPGAHPLLQASVNAGSSAKSARFFLIDPNGGSLSVSSAGGSGGSGGKGGRGGRGGSGGSGSPPGSSGSSGSDGRNGSDGRSGNNGVITVYYDPSAASMLGLIHASAKFVQAPIGQLW